MQVLGAENRLPPDYRSLLPQNATGVLFAPDRGVPIHRQTVERFAKAIKAGKPAYIVPEIPISSELGLPRYEPLLYWHPQTGTKRSLLSRMLRRLTGRPAVSAPNFVSSHDEIPQLASAVRITESSKEEQIHYFADHWSVLSPKPIQVSVVLSNTCNLKCIMCPYHSPEIRPTHTTDFFDVKRYMAWEVMEKIALECGNLRIGLKVGNIEEPLLHPKIIDFIRLARSNGVPSFHITSNGLPLTERRIRELFDAGLTSIYISMDASRKDTYARVRGADLDKVEANVRKLLAIRKEMNVSCSIRTSFVKNTGVSAEEVDEFREKWMKEVDGVIFYNLAEYAEGNSRFVEIHRFVEEKLKHVGERWACLSPFQEIYLLPDGRVYYCCETISKLAFENLQSMGTYPDQSIPELWHGALFRKIRSDLILNKLDDWSACKECGMWMAHVGKSEKKNGRVIHLNMITEVVDKAA